MKLFYTNSIVVLPVLLFSAIIGLFLYTEYTKRLDQYTNTKLLEFEHSFKAAQKALGITADTTLLNIIKKDEILEIMADAVNADEKKQADLRQRLYRKLDRTYANLRKIGIRQLHFHLPKAISFLRFHRPDKFGDSLWDVRYSIKQANIFKTVQFGFEEGRIFNGFRHVYPLFYHETFVGTVELSYSFLGIRDFIASFENVNYFFMLNKKIVSQKVWEDEKSNYLTGMFNDDFVMDKAIVLAAEKSAPSAMKIDDTWKIVKEFRDEIAEKIAGYEMFTYEYSDNGSSYLFHFLPLKNVEGQFMAYVVSMEKDDLINSMRSSFYQKVFGLFAVIALVLIALVRLARMRQLNVEKHSAERQNRYLKSVFDHQKAMMCIMHEGTIYDANRTFFDFFDVKDSDEFMEKRGGLNRFFLNDDDARYLKANQRDQVWSNMVALDEKSYKVKIGFEGEKAVFTVDAQYVRFESKEEIIIVFTDITEIEMERKRMEVSANTDALTSLANRTLGVPLLEQSIVMANRHSHSLSVVIFDIDHFKKINDTYGHNAGDEVLVQIASLTKRMLRSSDTAIRWGGEEFVIILSETAYASALQVAEKLRGIIESSDFPGMGKITCSFGVASLQADDDLISLLDRADRQLYKAKESGRNGVM